jgi:cell surface protein SprA
MKNLPVVTSQIQILRIELWVTTRTGDTRDRRDVVALMDLGKTNLWQLSATDCNRFSNNSNGLYAKIVGDPSSRNPALVVNELQSLGLTPVQRF